MFLYLSERTHEAGFNDLPPDDMARKLKMSDDELQDALDDLRSTDPPLVAMRDDVVFLKQWDAWIEKALSKQALEDVKLQAGAHPLGTERAVADQRLSVSYTTPPLIVTHKSVE